jgi:hypothetical protein
MYDIDRVLARIDAVVYDLKSDIRQHRKATQRNFRLILAVAVPSLTLVVLLVGLVCLFHT